MMDPAQVIDSACKTITSGTGGPDPLKAFFTKAFDDVPRSASEHVRVRGSSLAGGVSLWCDCWNIWDTPASMPRSKHRARLAEVCEPSSQNGRQVVGPFSVMQAILIFFLRFQTIWDTLFSTRGGVEGGPGHGEGQPEGHDRGARGGGAAGQGGLLPVQLHGERGGVEGGPLPVPALGPAPRPQHIILEASH